MSSATAGRAYPGAQELAGRFLVAVFAAMAIFIAALGGLGWLSGATWTPTTMALKQKENKSVILAPADVRYYAALKVARIAVEQPEIISIGNSRCSELRSLMFRPYRFYNGCLSAWTLPQIVEVFDRVTTVSSPKTVIVSIDYFQFSDIYAAAEVERDPDFSEGFGYQVAALHSLASALTTPSAASSPTIRDIPRFVRGDWSHDDADNITWMGPTSDRAHAGFRYDGAMQYDAGTIAMAPAQNSNKLKGLIEAVPGAPHVSQAQLATFRRLGEMARQRHVALVGVQWPILASVVDFLDHDKGYWDYSGIWREFQSAKIQREIANDGMRFFDLARAAVTTDGRNFIDPAHATESGDLAAIIEIMERPEFVELFPRLDRAGLRADYARSIQLQQYVNVYGNRFD
jgi:hypothetical protein